VTRLGRVVALAAYPKKLCTTCKITYLTVSLPCDAKVKTSFLAIAAGVATYRTIGPQQCMRILTA